MSNRLLLAIGAFVAGVVGCSAPPPTEPGADVQRQTVIGRVEAHTGTWRIEGRRYQSSQFTDLDYESDDGDLVRVTYAVEDGVAVATEIERIGVTASTVTDGPYVSYRRDGGFDVVSYADGRVIREIFAPGEGPAGLAYSPEVPPASYDMPARLLVLSDLEGNHDALVEFLHQWGVTNTDGAWAWGDGHLLFNGDMVDRGDEVTETLWLVHALEQQAAAQGGRVHFVIGNHEAMILAGDLRYIHPKYAYVSQEIGRSYNDLYGPDTVLGHWLRTRNAVVRIGDLLFVHGGISPALIALDLDLVAMNDRVRNELGSPKPPRNTPSTESLAWGRHGPLWYRGYFADAHEVYGPVPSDGQLDQILDHFGVRHIAVGHTVVDDIGWIDDRQRLIGVDVDWASGDGEGLLVEGGQLQRLTTDGTAHPLTR